MSKSGNVQLKELYKFMNSIFFTKDIEKSNLNNMVKKTLNGHAQLENVPKEKVFLASGFSNGAVCGKLVSTYSQARKLKKNGQKVIFLAEDTTMSLIPHINDFDGLIFLKGTSASHVVIEARSKKIPTIFVNDGNVVEILKKVQTDPEIDVCIDGTYGYLILGTCKIYVPQEKTIDWLKEWCNRAESELLASNKKTCSIAYCVHSAREAKMGRIETSAIGLTRIENMFCHSPERLNILRKLMLHPDSNVREEMSIIQSKLIQQDVFDILNEIDGKRLIIRLMDILPSELMPEKHEIKLFLKNTSITIEQYEFVRNNALDTACMMGTRGSRYGLTQPNNYRREIEGLLCGAYRAKRKGACINEFTIIAPFIRTSEEMKNMATMIKTTNIRISKEYNDYIDVIVGCMIEIPSAALMSKEIAKHSDFFCYGLNDLSQFSHALSRDNLDHNYMEKSESINPFKTFDVSAVGRLVKMSIDEGKAANPKLQIGIFTDKRIEDFEFISFCNSEEIDFLLTVGDILYGKIVTIGSLLQKLIKVS